jgi:hypothetical protein
MGTTEKRFRKRTKIERLYQQIRTLQMLNEYLRERMREMIALQELVHQNQLDERTEQCTKCV